MSDLFTVSTMHNTDIGNRIQDLLERSGTSPEFLGRQVGYSGRQVSRWINAESGAPIKVRAEIADYFGIDRSELGAEDYIEPRAEDDPIPTWALEVVERLKQRVEMASPSVPDMQLQLDAINDKLDDVLARLPAAVKVNR
ncbi:MAG: helix-turn-helix transcriptional regulator [Thermoleophilia bacterium]|nr:helix-turn-helix transcriptional regulator [Thermoleophilia bacterium]